MSAYDAGPANEALFDRYIFEWQEYHNITERRRVQQLWTLRKFATGLGPERTMLDVTSQDIRAWLADRRAAGYAPGTIRLHINYFRPFYTWAYQSGLINGDKLLDVRSVKPPQGTGRGATVPRPYNKRERERFWREFEVQYPWTRDGSSKARGSMFLGRYLSGRSKWIRARYFCKRLEAEAIVALAIYGGLRRHEIYQLRLDDLDPENEYVIVRSARKGAWRSDDPRERAVPWITEAMRDAVEEWLRCRGILESHVGGFDHDCVWLHLGLREPYIFCPMPTKANFNSVVARVGDWSFHRMRHTAATEMLRAGVPLQVVSRIIGHSNIMQTQGYTKLIADDLVHEVRLAQVRFDNNMRRDRRDAA